MHEMESPMYDEQQERKIRIYAKESNGKARRRERKK